MKFTYPQNGDIGYRFEKSDMIWGKSVEYSGITLLLVNRETRETLAIDGMEHFDSIDQKDLADIWETYSALDYR